MVITAHIRGYLLITSGGIAILSEGETINLVAYYVALYTHIKDPLCDPISSVIPAVYTQKEWDIYIFCFQVFEERASCIVVMCKRPL